MAISISVIIPIYNTEKYLDECIQSVLNQSKSFDRIILINDGSTDNSLNICEVYAKRHTNIIIVSQTNKGQSIARNRGLEYVKSEYVMFLDSDDYLHTDTVKKVLFHLQKDNLDILYFDSKIINELNKDKITNFYDRVGRANEDVVSGVEYFVNCYPNAYVVQPCMAVFRTSFLFTNNLLFPEYAIFEDTVFSFKAMLCGKRVKYVPEKLYVRRYRPESTMTKRMNYKDCMQLLISHRECWNHMIEIQQNIDPNIIDNFRIYLIRSYWEIKRYFTEALGTDSSKFVYEINKLAISFIEIWSKLNRQDDKYMPLSLLSSICRLIQNIDIKIDNCLYIYFCDGSRNWREYYLELYKDRIKKVLIKLPLNISGKRVGIYGTGNHTCKLIKWYLRLIGEIKCDLYYIDTYKESFSTIYNERPLINILDADMYVDVIILSSIAYEHKMYMSVRELFYDKINIIRFYDIEKDDIFIEHKNV